MKLMFVVALCATLVACIFAQEGVSGDDLHFLECLEVTSASLYIRKKPCGDLTNSAVAGRVFRYAGKTESCNMYGGGDLVEYVAVYIDKEYVYAASSYLQKAKKRDCRYTDANDLPYYLLPPFYYIQSTSPSKRRLSGWSKSARTIDDVMDKWSCYLIPDKQGNHDRIEDLFDIMDNDDGLLTATEFHDFPFHASLDIDLFKDLVTANDMDESGYLDIDEFVDMFQYRYVDCSRV